MGSESSISGGEGLIDTEASFIWDISEEHIDRIAEKVADIVSERVLDKIVEKILLAEEKDERR